MSSQLVFRAWWGTSKMLFGPIVYFQFACTESRKPHSFIALYLSFPTLALRPSSSTHLWVSTAGSKVFFFLSWNHFFIRKRANLIVAIQNPKTVFSVSISFSLSISLGHSHSMYLLLFHSMRMQSFHVYVLNFPIEYIIKIILKMVQFGSFNRCKRIYSFPHSHKFNGICVRSTIHIIICDTCTTIFLYPFALQWEYYLINFSHWTAAYSVRTQIMHVRMDQMSDVFHIVCSPCIR